MNDSAAPHSRVEIAIAVVEQDGKYLIGLRPEGVPLAGLWEFPGGKMQPAESPLVAARRECLEETGLAVRVSGAYPTADYDYPHAAVRLHFVACAPLEQKRPLPERFHWVERSELANYEFPPANAAILKLMAD